MRDGGQATSHGSLKSSAHIDTLLNGKYHLQFSVTLED